MKKNYLLSFLFVLLMVQANAQPTTTAATPPVRNSANVISIYSAAYTNLAGTDFNPNWGQAGFGAATEITVLGDQIRSYPNMNYQGVQFQNGINLSSMDSLHLDIWTPNCTSFDIYLVAGAGAGERSVNRTLTLSGWNSVNIKLSDYSSQGLPLGNIIQFKFVAVTPGSGANIYIDNIYFFTNASLPTLSNFSIAPHFVGDAPFTLTPPTSNSTGAFTYSSSNTSVATVSGNTVTIVGAGTTTITATQAAAGAYSSGTITANLVVTYAPPATAAPVPTKLAANVISLYSDSYTNVAGIDWNPNWGQSTTVGEVAIASNNTRKYESLNYQGVQLATALNVSTMNFLHVDIWTPNCTSFKIFLINTSPTTVEQAYTITPSNTGWNSVDIPLTSYNTVNLSSINQIKFEAVPFGSSTVYLDNFYFWKNSTTTPVSLIGFRANKNGNASSLTWQTLSENNNKGFAVERSVNGINWNEFAFVNGAGNSNTIQNYSVADNTPAKGINYYRLKQIDNDGKTAYSAIVSLKFDNTQNFGFSFYPNPVKQKLTVMVDNISTSKASLSIVTTDGKMVKSFVLSTQNANSSFSVDVTSLTSGTYYLVLKDGAVVKSEKMIIE